jgi:hypothetical protein
MGHVAKRKTSGHSLSTRLTLEPLESRALLSANLGYGPDRDVGFGFQSEPGGGHHSDAFIGSATYEPPHREQYAWNEIDREPSMDVRSAEHEPRIESYSIIWIISESQPSPQSPGAPAALSAGPKPNSYSEKIIAGGPLYGGSGSEVLSPISAFYVHTTPVSYLTPTYLPVTTANLVDAKAQLDASRSTASSATSRVAAAEESCKAFETSPAQRATSRDSVNPMASAGNAISNDRTADQSGADKDGDFVELDGPDDASESKNASSFAEARRAAIDAALGELSRMRDGVGQPQGQRLANRNLHRGKPSNQPASQEQPNAQSAEDPTAGMVLLRADGDAEIVLAAGRALRPRPAIEAMIGVYRAIDLGADESSVAPAAPISQPPKVGVEEIDAAMSRVEREPVGHRSAKAAGAALAAGAITLAVRHEVLSERKKRHAKTPR